MDIFCNWLKVWIPKRTLLNILPLWAKGIALVHDVTCKMNSKFRGIIPLEAIITYRN